MSNDPCLTAQEPTIHPAEQAARDYREHTIVALPDGGQNQLWGEVQALTAERDKLVAHLTQIHALVGRHGRHEGCHLEMASCALSGVSVLSMDLRETREEVQVLSRENTRIRAKLAEWSKQSGGCER